MEIKGTAVKSIIDYVKKNHPNQIADWYNSLNDEAKNIINSVVTSGWYSMKDGAIEPTKKIGTVFFDSDFKKAAIESGRYSAEAALHGVYKLYVKFSSPGHIISRASRILPAYYRPSKMEIADKTSNSVKVLMTDFIEPSDIIEYRIYGWIERALEISGCKGIDVSIVESMTKGDSRTVFLCSWS